MAAVFRRLLLNNRKFTKYVCMKSDTIFALSSGQGKCGVAVIRVSGPSSQEALKLIIQTSTVPKPRMALLKNIIHPHTKEILDKGLVLWFPSEDCFELHIHGSVAVVNAVLNALSTLQTLRLAEPGEFTRRAFYNGKLDLTEVEGLADLLQAETESQRKQSFLQMQGSLSKLYNTWKKVLLQSVAHIEADIDFSETETIDGNLLKKITSEVRTLQKEMQIHLESSRRGEILRNGVKTVILGEPNTGKSSLLNLICQRPAAIVTPIEGTTRDILEVTLNIDGYPLVLVDTAGLRKNTENIVEKEGINRALSYAENADLIILMVNSINFAKWSETNNFLDYLKYYVNNLGLSDLIDKNCDDLQKILKKNCIIVVNKIDLMPLCIENSQIVCISCKLEQGIDELLNSISTQLKLLCGDPSSEHPSMNQTRHKEHLTNCLNYLNLFIKKAENDYSDTVLLAEYLRKSLKELGKLVGTVTNEDILNVIFKDFCIGK